jgi:nucleotide-binding universal stress UspA family protein
MKTLLTAIDFSPISTKVVNGAAELAVAMNAKIILLSVLEPAAAYIPIGAAMDVITAPMNMEPQDINLVKERLEHLAQPVRDKGLTVETIVTVSLPSDEILDQAMKTGASMIVLGSHGHGAAYQFFSGSVVTSVLHKARLPVTVIPVHAD